jgi:hypothetical protein
MQHPSAAVYTAQPHKPAKKPVYRLLSLHHVPHAAQRDMHKCYNNKGILSIHPRKI